MAAMPARPAVHGASVDSFLSRPLVGDAVLAALLAAVLGPMSVSLLRSAASPTAEVAAAGLCVLVLHLCVVWRRRTPRTAYLLAAVATLGLVLLPPLQDASGVAYAAVLLPSSMAFALLLYTVAGRVPRRPALVALAVALAGVLAVLVRLWDPATWGGSIGSFEPWVWRSGLAVALAGVVVCLWTLGRLSGVRRLYLEELRAKAERAEQDRARERAEATRAERDRIRRELHDVVSHSLAVMVSQAEGGRLQDPHGPGAEAFATIGRVGRESLRDMRALLGVLSGEEGPGRAPAPRLMDLPALLAQVRGAGLRVDLVEEGEPHELRPVADLTAYRVVQEALTNVLKHGGEGAVATVSVTWAAEQVVLQIDDDGAAGGALHPGAGLTGMQERTRLVGGSLAAGARPGGGFRIRATIPYDERSGPSSG